MHVYVCLCLCVEHEHQNLHGPPYVVVLVHVHHIRGQADNPRGDRRNDNLRVRVCVMCMWVSE